MVSATAMLQVYVLLGSYLVGTLVGALGLSSVNYITARTVRMALLTKSHTKNMVDMENEHETFLIRG
jgi:hypothetical protein